MSALPNVAFTPDRFQTLRNLIIEANTALNGCGCSADILFAKEALQRLVIEVDSLMGKEGNDDALTEFNDFLDNSDWDTEISPGYYWNIDSNAGLSCKTVDAIRIALRVGV